MSGNRGAAAPDIPRLLVNGQVFTGWTEIRVTRGIERLATDFAFRAPGPWPGEKEGWPIKPFATCEIRLGDDKAMTGYIDGIDAELEPDEKGFKVDGRSKTADLVDCHALVDGGEFRDSTLAAICRAIAQPFGIEVRDTANAGRVVIPTEAADQTETCFRFLERLARQASVLLTDDAEGNLVIARTSAARCSSTLRQGANLLRAALTIKVEKRFDRYFVKGQLPSGASWISELARAEGEGQAPGGDARPHITGQVTDQGVPRYRPFVMHAEGNQDAAGARARALWQMRRDIGRSLQLKATVPGWRQEDGRLWQINELAPCVVPAFGLEEELLISSVSYTLDRNGRQTLLTLSFPEAFTPEPPAAPKRSGSGGSGGASWIQQLPSGAGRE